MVPVVRLAHEADPIGVAVKTDRRRTAESHCSHARQAAQAIRDPLLNQSLFRVGLEGCVGCEDVERCEVSRIEAEVHLEQVKQAARQESRADQQHNRGRHFQHNDLRADASPAQAAAARGAACECRTHPLKGHAKRRHGGKHNGSQQRFTCRKHQGSRGQVHRVQKRHGVVHLRRDQQKQQAHHAGCAEQAGGNAHGNQCQAFHRKLPGQAGAGGPQRSAQSKLAAARVGPRQQQARHIQAGNYEQQ